MAIFRLATLNDVDDIIRIYKPYVEETTISFEYVVPTKQEFEKRIKSIMKVYPFILCIIDGEVAGYGYASKKQERVAYSWRAECSIYIDSRFHRRGIASAVYGAVLEILEKQGYYNAYAVITSPNKNSEKFHKSLGFKKIAHYNKTAYKHGEWRDIFIYEKYIRKHEGKPSPTKTIKELDKNILEEVLNHWQQKIIERK